jgi:hypothetical protein
MYAEYRAYRDYLSFWNHGHGGTGWQRSWRSYLYNPNDLVYGYIGRDGRVGHTKTPVEDDMQRAYFNAVRWVLSGDKRHAMETFRILDGYAQYLKGFMHGGFYDHMLMVGMQGMLYAASAEIIRYAVDVVNGESSGFIPEQFHNIDRSIRDIWLKAVVEDYINIAPWRAGNQGAMVIAAYFAIAIYLDDPSLLADAVHYMLHRPSCGNIRDYFHHFSGQLGEATRSQSYVGLAMAKTLLSAEMAWRQGYDLYAAYDNVLFRAQEFASRFNIGDNNVQSAARIPFDPHGTIYFFDNQWIRSVFGRSITTSGRGGAGRGVEISYNHYVRRLGMEMPWTEAMLPLHGNDWARDDSPPGFASFLNVGYELSRELGLWD